MSFKDVCNQALNVTLSRTIMTSGTTIFDQSGNHNDLTYTGTDPFIVILISHCPAEIAEDV